VGAAVQEGGADLLDVVVVLLLVRGVQLPNFFVLVPRRATAG
jgi:hypothetical protein